MATIIAVGNRKGGVGKTATAFNLAANLAQINPTERVFLVDLDPQGDCTRVSGAKDVEVGQGLGYLLLEEQTIREATVSLDRSDDGFPRPNLYLIPADDYLSVAKTEIISLCVAKMASRRRGGYQTVAEYAADVLRRTFSPLQEHIKYIILDCPPSLDEFQVPAYALADTLVVPVKCDAQGVAALRNQTGNITDAQSDGVNINISYVLPTFYKHRELVSRDAYGLIQRVFRERVFDPVPQTVVMEKSAARGLSAYEFEPDSMPAQVYMKLAENVEAQYG